MFVDSKGVEQGRHTLTAVGDRLVQNRLLNRGPGGREMRPEVDFRLAPLEGGRTRVDLGFRARPPLPTLCASSPNGCRGRKVHALHVKDLAQLKAHVEGASAAT